MRIGYREVKRDLRISDVHGIKSLQVSVWWDTLCILVHTHTVPVPKRLRQDDQDFKVILDYITTLKPSRII